MRLHVRQPHSWKSEKRRESARERLARRQLTAWRAGEMILVGYAASSPLHSGHAAAVAAQSIKYRGGYQQNSLTLLLPTKASS